jgi:uncharacterized ion transporter superfamily protein YfcC
MINDDVDEINDLDELIPNSNESQNNKDEKVSQTEENKEGCQFPSAFTILLIIHCVVFILIYIIPKGKYDTIEYSSGNFTIKSYGKKDDEVKATKEYLEEKGIKVPLSSFENGYIKNPISIPNTYKRINVETTNFLNIVYYPILGLIDSADISFFLMLLGGCLNILTEMNAISSGIRALSKVTKGKGFLLLCLVYIIITIGANTYGMSEETLPFYPILMPIFLKSGIDGILGVGGLFLGISIGNMFSTVNAFSVVVASYSAGINFLEGIVLRIICLILLNTLTILYFYHYYRKIQLDEKSSIVYEIKKKLEDKYLKDEKDEKENNDKTGKFKKEIKDEKFTIKQKIVLILFLSSIIGLVVGVLIFNWWFEHMGSIFLVLGIILMFFLGKKESSAIKVFMQGVSDFAGFGIILGFSRGINITLEKGLIADTILNALINITVGLPKIIFAILMFIIFIFLGFLISGWTSLAILSMPVVAPLADEVNVSRTLVINAYMFGQSYIQIISPSALILIVLELVGIQYNHWIRFIYPYMIILFVLLVIILMINTAF